ncbi:MAG: nitroreductase family protein [Chloroflexi bacterium]|nr:nitroreductase family protein [Chloroflexota bacterium]MYF22768.1 nitroreductase family protein [Chloroflexota bacterium]
MPTYDSDHILTTTRSVRLRLDFDRPIEPELITECLEIALQAPTASNSQQWQWLVITDPEKIAGIGGIYKDSFMELARGRADEGPRWPEGDSRAAAAEGVTRSATYLAENMHRCPALLIACITGRVEDAGPMAQAGTYGSILPGAWSFMLAARSRGIGMAWTTLHLRDESLSRDLLGIPEDVTQAVLFPMAYFTGETFKPAPRVPLEEVVHWNNWGQRTPDG